MTKTELLAKAAADRRTYVWHVETAPPAGVGTTIVRTHIENPSDGTCLRIAKRVHGMAETDCPGMRLASRRRASGEEHLFAERLVMPHELSDGIVYYDGLRSDDRMAAWAVTPRDGASPLKILWVPRTVAWTNDRELVRTYLAYVAADVAHRFPERIGPNPSWEDVLDVPPEFLSDYHVLVEPVDDVPVLMTET